MTSEKNPSSDNPSDENTEADAEQTDVADQSEPDADEKHEVAEVAEELKLHVDQDQLSAWDAVKGAYVDDPAEPSVRPVFAHGATGSDRAGREDGS